MYPVRAEYKEAMRKPFRDGTSHARVYFGIFDKTAAPDASLSFSSCVEYGSALLVNTSADLLPGYATFEPDQFRLDGSQRLLPRSSGAWTPQAFISSVQSGDDGVFETPPFIRFVFTGSHSMVGLTLTFDRAFSLPAQISVLTYRAEEAKETYVLSDISDYEYKAELLIEDVDDIIIRFDKTATPNGRARLNKVDFGIGYTYADSMLIDVTETHTGSPVSLELPTSNFSLTLYNGDHRFDVDSGTALQRFLAAGQDVSVDYGYSSGGWTQQIPGGEWQLSTWKTNGIRATFTMTDAMDPLTRGTYDKGVYDGQQHTLYDLAIAVLEDAGIPPEKYYVGPFLKQTSTAEPLPVQPHAVLLQLIANAGRARLFVDRSGRICFETIIESDPTASSSSAQTPYSDVASVLTNAMPEYATFEPDVFAVSGTFRLLPDEGATSGGWVVDAVSGEDLAYPDNELLLTYEAPTNVFSMNLDWGAVVPAEVLMEGREDGAWSQAITVRPRSQKERYAVQFTHVDAIRVRLVRAPRAGVRPRIMRIGPSMLSDFTLTKDQIFNNPKGTMDPRLRNVTASWVSRSAAAEPETITTYTPDTDTGIVTVEHDLALDLTAAVTEGSATIVSQTHYAYVSYIELGPVAGLASDITITLTGRPVTAVYRTAVAVGNDTGEDMDVENPLLDSAQVAQDVVDWVRDYYMRRIIYNDDTRGFPELDQGDTIYLDGDASALITKSTLKYNGAFRSTLTLRR